MPRVHCGFQPHITGSLHYSVEIASDITLGFEWHGKFMQKSWTGSAFLLKFLEYLDEYETCPMLLKAPSLNVLQ
jgi:hypothetical protein